MAPPPPGAYALLDRQAAKVYTSSYQLTLPPEITTVPPDATIVWTHHAYPPGTVSRRLLETIQGMAQRLPAGKAVTSRVDRMITDMIEGDDAVLYRLPSP